MGSLLQSNEPLSLWTGFFIERRLQPLVKTCFDEGLLGSKHISQFEKLYTELPAVFGTQVPSLVHGDLWSGNFIAATDSTPVLIDPAAYFGVPAVDIGMSKLFGGFDAAFYEAYNYHATPSREFDEQCMVCNLYPLLVHLKLFGSGYLRGIEQILGSFRN
jgi:protein-ribulosamine 3-kinase